MVSRYFLRKIVISNRVLNNGLFWYWRLKNFQEKKKIIDRSKLSIEDYDLLAKPLKRCPSDNVLDNNFYGISHSIKTYSNYFKKLNFFIEHGVYFGSIIHPYEKDYYVPNIIVPSLVRKRHLEDKIKKSILTVGPYIHYAKDYISNESFNILKQKLGKVLLVFPDHSPPKIDSQFDPNLLINTIELLKTDYDTVLICLYWQDILLGRDKEYNKKGYKVVSAGHMLDYNFMSRLKLIINLSDITISNSIGTHLGYSIYLGKPHTVFKQDITYNSSDKKYLEYDSSIYNSETLNSLITERNEVEGHFLKFSTIISEKQWNIVDKYWGISEIKSPTELHDLLRNGE